VWHVKAKFPQSCLRASASGLSVLHSIVSPENPVGTDCPERVEGKNS